MNINIYVCIYSYTHAYIHMTNSIDVEKTFDKFKAILYFKAIYKVGIGKKKIYKHPNSVLCFTEKLIQSFSLKTEK